MKRKAILHIGCEKTGSTSIQNFLYLNRNDLLVKHGCLYPVSLGKRNHTKLGIYTCNDDKGLVRFLSKGQTLRDFRKNLESEFTEEVKNTSANTIIISNEWLHPRVKSKEEFNRLLGLFENLFSEVKVILYVRQQDKLALSLYSTSLKSGNYKPFRFPVVNDRTDLPYFYDFNAIYGNWVSAFGRGNVYVRVFDRDALVKSDVVMDFLELLDVPKNGLMFTPEENLSLSNTGVFVMRLWNRSYKNVSRFIKPRIGRKVRGLISKCFPGRPSLASEYDCEDFLKKFSISNKRLRENVKKDLGHTIDI